MLTFFSLISDSLSGVRKPMLWRPNRKRITNILIGLGIMYFRNACNHIQPHSSIHMFLAEKCLLQLLIPFGKLYNCNYFIPQSFVAAQERGDYKSLDRNRNFLTNACSDCGSTEHSVWGFEDNGLTTTVTNFSRDWANFRVLWGFLSDQSMSDYPDCISILS